MASASHHHYFTSEDIASGCPGLTSPLSVNYSPDGKWCFFTLVIFRLANIILLITQFLFSCMYTYFTYLYLYHQDNCLLIFSQILLGWGSCMPWICPLYQSAADPLNSSMRRKYPPMVSLCRNSYVESVCGCSPMGLHRTNGWRAWRMLLKVGGRYLTDSLSHSMAKLSFMITQSLIDAGRVTTCSRLACLSV